MKNKASGPGLSVVIGGPGAPGGGPSPKPGAAADKQGMDGDEDCVPVSALAMPDETEQMQAPEVGDKVQYTVEGKVASIDGENAYIEREAINGQPVGDDKPEAQTPPENPDASSAPGPGADDDKDLADLQDMAGKTQLY